MNLRYVFKELTHQKRRTVISIVGLSIGIAIFVILNALSLAYHEAARAPLKEIGADITVQRPGNVPENLTGAVFPCSAVTISEKEIKDIETIPGIRGIGRAVLLWVFDPNRAWIVMGIEQENPVGPSILKNFILEGRYFEPGKPEVLVDASYARQFGIKLGDHVTVAGRSYPVVALISASNASKIAVANLYMPIGEAQAIAAASKPLQTVSPFSGNDVNLLFIRADQERITSVAGAVKGILGPKTAVATPESFLKLLGSLFALSDKFTLAASVIAMLIAILIAFKTMAGNVAERAREIGVMKAVGWTQRNVVGQLFAESVIQCFAAGILGLLVAQGAAFVLSFMTVSIPIPWEMSPTPHFLAGGGDPLFKTLHLPVHIPLSLAAFALFLSVLIGGLTGTLLGRHIAKIKPSEVLRHE
ncbi:MAG: ABC transporter permease [Syntrophales bacterium]|nr:ABC transporter permease [Syntrophales bacterium]